MRSILHEVEVRPGLKILIPHKVCLLLAHWDMVTSPLYPRKSHIKIYPESHIKNIPLEGRWDVTEVIQPSTKSDIPLSRVKWDRIQNNHSLSMISKSDHSSYQCPCLAVRHDQIKSFLIPVSMSGGQTWSNQIIPLPVSMSGGQTWSNQIIPHTNIYVWRSDHNWWDQIIPYTKSL